MSQHEDEGDLSTEAQPVQLADHDGGSDRAVRGVSVVVVGGRRSDRGGDGVHAPVVPDAPHRARQQDVRLAQAQDELTAVRVELERREDENRVLRRKLALADRKVYGMAQQLSEFAADAEANARAVGVRQRRLEEAHAELATFLRNYNVSVRRTDTIAGMVRTLRDTQLHRNDKVRDYLDRVIADYEAVVEKWSKRAAEAERDKAALTRSLQLMRYRPNS